MFSTPALAGIDRDDLDGFSSLTETQKAEIIKQVDSYKNASNATTADTVKQTMMEWSEVGAGLGVMIVSVAKELGVAANEFAQTPLGRLAIVVGLTYMFGSKLLGVIVWFACWFIFAPIVWRSFMRFKFDVKTERTVVPDEKFLFIFPVYNTKVQRTEKNMGEGTYMIHLVAGAAFLVTGLICLVNF